MFKAGDRVRVLPTYYSPDYVGLVGEVVEPEGGSIGCFFEALRDRGKGHNLGGLIRERRGGWWIEASYLALVEKESRQWPPKARREPRYKDIPVTYVVG